MLIINYCTFFFINNERRTINLLMVWRKPYLSFICFVMFCNIWCRLNLLLYISIDMLFFLLWSLLILCNFFLYAINACINKDEKSIMTNFDVVGWFDDFLPHKIFLFLVFQERLPFFSARKQKRSYFSCSIRHLNGIHHDEKFT